jgi:hypothetical protein
MYIYNDMYIGKVSPLGYKMQYSLIHKVIIYDIDFRK